MSDTNPEKKTLLSTLKEITFFVAIYLYFMGFVYISSFYDNFGIPLRSLDTPVYAFFVYSYNVMTGVLDIAKQNKLRASIVAIVVVALIVVVARRRNRKGVMLFASLVILFPLVFYAASITARNDALKVRTQETAKEITFVFKKDVSARSSIRVLKEFTTGKDDTASPPEKKGAGKTNRNQTSSQGPEKTAKGEAESTEESAELLALQRFLDANKRIDVEEKSDKEANVTTVWPKLYLVTETSTSFYVILQPSLETGSLPYGYVYEVAKADVLVSEIKIPD
jgi:hypothetical protein